jgi:hypothetical protein
MKAFIAILCVFILVFIGLQIYRLRSQSLDFENKIEQLNGEASVLSIENRKLERDLKYYDEPVNLGKEALKYNRKKPGEEVYILIPPKSN